MKTHDHVATTTMKRMLLDNREAVKKELAAIMATPETRARFIASQQEACRRCMAASFLNASTKSALKEYFDEVGTPEGMLAFIQRHTND